MNDEMSDNVAEPANEVDFYVGDHRDEQGLVVCGGCGEHKQKIVPACFSGNPPHVVNVPCKCERAYASSSRMERARDECFPCGGFYRNAAFETDDKEDANRSRVCERFADIFNPSLEAGLLLWGGAGSGKTFTAACIANRVMERGYSALMVDIGYVVSLMESSFEHRRSNLDHILGYDLLVIDDLGAQRTTGYMMEHVYNVVNGRYNSGKPMVVTTNIPWRAMSEADDSSPWYRVFDRIIERCYPIEFDNASKRRQKALSSQLALEEQLGIAKADG